MKRYVRVVLVCCAVLSLSCGAIVVIGRLQPVLDLIPEVSKCEGGTWCYLGIVPGETTFTDAQRSIKNSPQLAFSKVQASVAYPGGTLFETYTARSTLGITYNVSLWDTVGGHADDKIVDRIRLEFSDESGINAWTLVTKYGAPCAITGPPVTGRIWGIYPRMALIFSAQGQRNPWVLKATLPLQGLEIFKGLRSCDQVLKNEGNQKWHGFGEY
jgi:hypothetical protein